MYTPTYFRAALGAVLAAVTVLAFAGCSHGTSNPTPTQTSVDQARQDNPKLTPEQAGKMAHPNAPFVKPDGSAGTMAPSGR